MIELKVQCDCGQRYKFDVEPVNGRMPFAVACPVCNVDGTVKADALLQQMPEYQDAQTPGPLTTISEKPRLRINASANVMAPPAPPPIASVSSAPPGRSIRTLSPSLGTAGKNSRGAPSFARGLLGGAIGALMGTIIYLLVFKLTGLQLLLVAKLMAIGVGGLAGWSAEYFGRGEGSNELGCITAVLVLSGIIGAQYFVALGWWNQILHTVEDAGYTSSIAEAKQAVHAIPTGSDEEIRIYLAQQEAQFTDRKPDTNAIDDQALKEFRGNQLPEFQELASGKMTKAQYLEKRGMAPDQMKKLQDTEEGTFKGVFIILLLSKTSIFSLIAAAGLAYKLSTNA